VDILTGGINRARRPAPKQLGWAGRGCVGSTTRGYRCEAEAKVASRRPEDSRIYSTSRAGEGGGGRGKKKKRRRGKTVGMVMMTEDEREAEEVVWGGWRRRAILILFDWRSMAHIEAMEMQLDLISPGVRGWMDGGICGSRHVAMR
jgi:hypothetical protein